jgi:hypothetical protein
MDPIYIVKRGKRVTPNTLSLFLLREKLSDTKTLQLMKILLSTPARSHLLQPGGVSLLIHVLNER